MKQVNTQLVRSLLNSWVIGNIDHEDLDYGKALLSELNTDSTSVSTVELAITCLKDWQQKGATYSGLCYAVESKTSLPSAFLVAGFISWPKHSGDLVYPIPDPDGALSPDEAYGVRTYAYQKLRYELSEHLVEFFESLLVEETLKPLPINLNWTHQFIKVRPDGWLVVVDTVGNMSNPVRALEEAECIVRAFPQTETSGM